MKRVCRVSIVAEASCDIHRHDWKHAVCGDTVRPLSRIIQSQ